MKEFFLNEKPVMALVTIKRNRDEVYCSIISRKIDTTYAHTVKIISRMEDEGLIESERDGRRKLLELTDKGEKYADCFLDIVSLMEQESIN